MNCCSVKNVAVFAEWGQDEVQVAVSFAQPRSLQVSEPHQEIQVESQPVSSAQVAVRVIIAQVGGTQATDTAHTHHSVTPVRAHRGSRVGEGRRAQNRCWEKGNAAGARNSRTTENKSVSTLQRFGFLVPVVRFSRFSGFASCFDQNNWAVRRGTVPNWFCAASYVQLSNLWLRREFPRKKNGIDTFEWGPRVFRIRTLCSRRRCRRRGRGAWVAAARGAWSRELGSCWGSSLEWFSSLPLSGACLCSSSLSTQLATRYVE